MDGNREDDDGHENPNKRMSELFDADFLGEILGNGNDQGAIDNGQQEANGNQTPYHPPQQDRAVPNLVDWGEELFLGQYLYDDGDLQHLPCSQTEFDQTDNQNESQNLTSDPHFYQQQEEGEANFEGQNQLRNANFEGQNDVQENGNPQGVFYRDKNGFAYSGFYGQNGQGVLPDPNANPAHFQVPQNSGSNLPTQHHGHVSPPSHNSIDSSTNCRANLTPQGSSLPEIDECASCVPGPSGLSQLTPRKKKNANKNTTEIPMTPEEQQKYQEKLDKNAGSARRSRQKQMIELAELLAKCGLGKELIIQFLNRLFYRWFGTQMPEIIVAFIEHLFDLTAYGSVAKHKKVKEVRDKEMCGWKKDARVEFKRLVGDFLNTLGNDNDGYKSLMHECLKQIEEQDKMEQAEKEEGKAQPKQSKQGKKRGPMPRGGNGGCNDKKDPRRDNDDDYNGPPPKMPKMVSVGQRRTRPY